MLVRLGIGAPADPEDIQEFEQLALSAGAIPVARIGGRRDRPDPRFFVGSGKADEIRAIAHAEEAEVVLFDHPLSPSQERNLEKLIERRVLDRSGLILDIFAQRARSHEGKLEVELAQLKHIASRLVRGWTHLERQRGGGIGNRGPGETQLETDRRLLAKRVKTLTARLEKLNQQRETGRQQRAEIPVPSLALVGYTNAGKSTLFRALTGADAYVADQLFATLDPTVRKIVLPGNTQVVVADTVGFIRELPHELVAAFQSTLTEAREATLLLHVVDVSDPRRDEHIDEVNRVLAEIGAADLPQILVFNKVDRIGTVPRWIATRQEPSAMCGYRPCRPGASTCCVTQLPKGCPGSRGAPPCACRSAPGNCARACMPPTWSWPSASRDDGAFEIETELSEFELLKWAREPGVKLLRLSGDSTCTALGAYLQSSPALQSS